uniref:Uncharacterized protein n=1 Tax=Anguilla anguilla TaxID=7936 RepID=A0A0E9QL58_ANGAN
MQQSKSPYSYLFLSPQPSSQKIDSSTSSTSQPLYLVLYILLSFFTDKTRCIALLY